MKKGFTLLEMLVVIGIIAVLVGLGAASYSTAQKKARDAKRQSDLTAAQQMLEQCYSVNTFQYPTVSNSSGTLSPSPCPNGITFSITDPLNNATYKYVVTASTVSSYTLSATLETTGGTFSVSNQQ